VVTRRAVAGGVVGGWRPGQGAALMGYGGGGGEVMF
jgi:hypothetical protein